MATLVLAAAGAAVGNAVGGAVLGIGAATIGQAAGAIVGGLIDQAILGDGQRAVVRGKASGLRIQGAEEGAVIPRVWGRMRVAGHVIWSTRFKEHVSSSGGGKGSGPRVTEHSYTISFAVALAEGEIDRIGRVWADGKIMDLEKVSYRLHRGDEDQGADPLIEAVEGDAPAHRGIAYIVFEDLPVGRYGNRIPQINAEVMREPDIVEGVGVPEEGLALSEILRGVAMSPGTGEFTLAVDPVREVKDEGASRIINVNQVSGRADALVSLDQLGEELPAVDAVSLVVSWFGTDLRAGECEIRPGVEYRETVTEPLVWSAGGADRLSAHLVGRDEADRPIYGGTPDDSSVIGYIREMNARGIRVMFYPFLLMDIAPGNGLPDPWGWGVEQAAFPWRGRITTSAAPGQPGSPDGTAAAQAEVDAFFGSAQPSDFAISGDAVVYSGPEEWSLRRMVLHYAWLCRAAGGVDSFCIGSEFRSLTQIRTARTDYPAVEAFRQLAADVRMVLGEGVKLGYAADWSEYFGHQPADGTGDRIFHLDPLWADGAIDFIGIDYYAPLTDWRDGYDHLDADEAKSIYDLDYLSSRFAAGENYDWYYASDADREAQVRSPISDGLHGEDWIYRPKDLLNWWSRPHFNRIDGARAASASPWVPKSKPIWLTEIGCAAIDKGSNQPNVFLDPKSSESGVPHFSSGERDDLIQRRVLQAAAKHFGEVANNPVSPIYFGPMLDMANVFVWTWDARPWPAFPTRSDLWSDGSAHETGHWLSGRAGSASLAAVVAEICAAAGLTDIDVSDLDGVVIGFADGQVAPPRDALQTLMLAFGFDAAESGGVLTFRMRGREVAATVPVEDMVAPRSEEGRTLELTRLPESASPERVRVGFVRADGDYQAGVEEALSDEAEALGVQGAELGVALSRGQARAIAERWLREAQAARDKASFALGPGFAALEPGDVLRLPEAGGGDYRIDRILDGLAREVSATRIDGALYAIKSLPGEDEAPYAAPGGDQAGPPGYRLLNAPWTSLGGAPTRFFGAVWADPWPGAVRIWASDREDDGYEALATATAESTVLRLLDPLPAGRPFLYQRVSVRAQLLSGSLSSADRLAVANGANIFAMSLDDGEWEMLQFHDAELQPDGTWLLSLFSRGLFGTEPLIAATTPAGATLVRMDSGQTLRLELPDDALFRERFYRIGPADADLSDPSYVTTSFSWDGVGLRPYAPVHLSAVEEGNGDLTVAWIRRSRTDPDTFPPNPWPLFESAERYRLRLYDQGGALVREVETTVPAWTYDAASRTADGLTGDVTFAVAQISEQVGPGLEGKVIHSV